MTDTFVLSAQTRTDFGTSAARRLRRKEDKVPAIIYGGKESTLPIVIEHRHIKKALENEGFYSHILTLDVDGKKEKTVLKAIQRHPSRPRILHMDFLRVSSKEKIAMHVPLHFEGEDVAPGLKTDGGIVLKNMTDVEIECLPGDLPEFIKVDISEMKLDQVLHLSDLKIPQGVEIVTLALGPEHDEPVVGIHLPRVAVEETVVEEEELPAEGEEGAEEGGEEKSEGKD